MEGHALITTVVAGFVLAYVFGLVASRLRLPPLVGYLVAGIVVGPFTPALVADIDVQLAEVGIILLMFGVGLNFSLKDLVSVQAVAVPGALIRIAVSTALGVALAWLLGWPLAGGIIFGLALSVASTVVLMKTLHDRHLVDSERGRIAGGWVIVEDIAMVLALVLIPAATDLMGVAAAAAQPDDPFVSLIERFSGIELGVPGVLAVTLLKLAAFVGFMFIVGRRLIPLLLQFTTQTGSRELFRLAILAIALGVAAGASYLFGISLALGAFFAGMILSENELSHRAAEESLPLRDAFAVLFFVSVGMLFDVSIVWRDPLPLLATLAIVLVIRLAVVHFTLVLFRRSPGTSLWISASLAQIGEFSFILATLGLTLGVLPTTGHDLIVAAAIVSILLNPLLVWLAEWLRPRLEERAAAIPEAMIDGRVEPVVGGEAASAATAAEEDEAQPTALTAHAILIGYGRVGTVVAEGLKTAKRPFLVIEDADGRVAAARADGLEVIAGNAAADGPLRLANVEGAATVIVAIPNAFEAGQAVAQARRANPRAQIVARAHSDEESRHLIELGADTAILGEREIGVAMLDLVSPSTIARTAGTAAVEAALAPAAVAAMAAAPASAPAEPPPSIDEEALARAIGAPIPPLVPPEFLPPEPETPPEPAPASAPRRPASTPGAAFSGRPAPKPASVVKPPEKAD